MTDPKASRDFRSLLQVAPRYIAVLVASAAICAVAAFLGAKSQQKLYTATTDIDFRSTTQDQQAAGVQAVTNTDPQAEIDTDLELASLPIIARHAAASLGVHDARAIEAATKISQVNDTYVVSVEVTWPSATRAAAIADAYARAVVAARQSTDGRYYANALKAVDLQLASLPASQKNGPQGLALQDRASSLEILSSLQASDAQVVQPAVIPSSPSSPKVARDILLGLLLGIALGGGLVLLLHRSDRIMREPSDLERVYDLPLLSVIPESRHIDETVPVAGVVDGASREIEVFRLLRAHLQYFNVDEHLKVVMIASAAPSDGKSTVSWNLALAAASAGSRALLIEADLRRPVVADRLGFQRGPGVSDVLVGATSLADALQSVTVGRGDMHAHPTADEPGELSVLVAGTSLPPNPVQMLESAAMRRLIEEARGRFDLIVVDTPPMAPLPDAYPLLTMVDGVVVVARLGRDRRDVAARLRATLQAGKAPLVGVVANGFRSTGPASYGYGYGYGAPEALATTPD